MRNETQPRSLVPLAPSRSRSSSNTASVEPPVIIRFWSLEVAFTLIRRIFQTCRITIPQRFSHV